MKRTVKISVQRQTVRALSNEAIKEVGGGLTNNYKCTGDTVESHGATCGRGQACQTWFWC